MPEHETSGGADLASPLPPGACWPNAPSGPGRLLRGIESFVEPLAAVLALWGLVLLREGPLTPRWMVLGILTFALAYPGRATLQAPVPRILVDSLLPWAWTCGLLLVLGHAIGQLGLFDRQVVLHWLWLAPCAQLAAHWLMRRAAPGLVRLQGPPLRAVVVGLNAQGSALADRLAHARDSGVQLLGVFDDRMPQRLPGLQRHRRLGRIEDIAEHVKAHQVQLVYLSLPMASQPRIVQLLDALKDTTASVYFVPDMFVTDLIQGRADSMCGLPVISVVETPFRGPDALVKRVSDVVLSVAILLVLSPLMLALAIAVRMSSPGPVIFRQRRYGEWGQEIIVWKFRTMRVTEDGPAVRQACRGDARVTALGRILRRSSLDELPQFFNVLQGRMSIVGPRPHAVAHNELYRPLIKNYMRRHKVKPGITGWAQVNGYRGETDTLEKMQGRVGHDLEYLRNWSLQLDLYIVWRTIRLVFKDGAAY